MAGGIDWFRWHHGSVTDPKFQLVAKKAGVRLGDVIAVWAFVLEKASADAERGTIGQIDFETLDFLLGTDEGTAARILDAMTARGLIEGTRVAKWDERQPKKEDESANERKRRQREREHAERMAGLVTGEESRDVTPCHADVTPGHAREEKRREEEKKTTSSSPARLPTCPYDALVGLYQEVLPELPAVRVMDDARKKGIRERWTWVMTTCKPDGTRRAQTQDEALAWFRDYFELARDNDFLMGRTARNGEHKNWKCDIDFLMTTRGLKQVLERTEVA